MNETSIKFKFLWRATFKNKVITQHPEDKYSKHNPEAEYNPSSFRDFLDYFEGHKSELVKFELISDTTTVGIDLENANKPEIVMDVRNRWGTYTKKTLLHREKRVLSDVRVIYYRKMEAKVVDGAIGEPRVAEYVLGYQGLDENGNNRQKTISVV